MRDPAPPPGLSAGQTWAALLAGEAAWSTPGQSPSACERVAAHVMLVALAATGTIPWVAVPHRLQAGTANPSLIVTGAAVATVCSLLLAVRPVGLLAGRSAHAGSAVWRATWRTTAGVTLIAASVTVLPGWNALLIWPLGVAVGADFALGGWAVGFRIDPRRWWLRTMSAPAHLGMVGALVALAITRPDSSVVIGLIGLWIAFQLAVLAAVATATTLEASRRHLRLEQQHVLDSSATAEHRRLAHWIHDDVCADLQLTSLRLRTRRLAPDDVAAELAELDHRLRLRQQREIIDSGQARVAELLQPYVRRAQTAGVTIVDVPTLDDASVRLDQERATLFARAVSNLVANAMEAGATEIGLRVESDARTLRVIVRDDAGGFDLSDVPAGRGLDSLRRDLGPDGLTVDPVPGGSEVVAHVPLAPSDTTVVNAPNTGRPVWHASS